MPQVVPLGYSNATLNQIIGTDLLSQPGIVADLQQYWLPVTFSNGSAAVTLGNTLTGTYTVTASKNSSELIIVGATPLTLALHRGHPISVTLGASTWSGIVESVYNSGGNQTIGINSAAGSPAAVSALASQALNVGVRLTSADQGKSIYIMGAFPLLHGPIISTIGTVTSANTLTLSGVVSNGDAASLTPMMVAWGTDNYAALSSVINASVQAGSRVLVVNGGIYTSKWPSAVVNMMLRGSGKIFVPPLGFTTDYSSTDALSPSQIKKPVIPLYAPESPPPETTMRGEDLFSKMAGVSSPNVVFVGASTFTSDPGGAGMASSPVRLIRNRLQRMNIGRKSFKFFEFAEGGQGINNYSHLTARSGTANWDVSGATPWIGQPSQAGYVYNSSPAHVFIESSANDAIDHNIMKSVLQIHAMLASYASPPNITWVSNAMKAETDTNIGHHLFDHNSKWLDGWCKTQGCGLINFRREFVKRRDGFDPHLDVMRSVQPYTTAINGQVTILTGLTKGFCVGLTYTGTAAAFWAAVGNQLGFTLGQAINDSGSTGYCPLFRVGYDATGAFPGGVADSIYWQVDLWQGGAPGMGLPNICKPTVLGGFAMTAGSNVLTYSASNGGPSTIFVAGDNGGILTVPGAGDTGTSNSQPGANGYVTTPWSGSYAAPLVGYMKYVSGTQVSLWADAAMTTTPLNAVNAISASTPQFVFRGSPRIYPGISGISSDSKTTTTMRFWSIGDEVGFWWQGRDDQAVRSVAVKPGGHTTLILSLAGSPSANSLNISQSGSGGPLLKGFRICMGRRSWLQTCARLRRWSSLV